MRATSFTHTSVHADDLEVSARWYEELFGLRRVPAPNFGHPVLWLQAGDLQLHLFYREDATAPQYHHIGFDVDDFEATLARAQELGLLDEEAWDRARVMPSGEVQAYLRDPAGNMVEIDHPDVTTLSAELRSRLTVLEEAYPQDDQNRVARLYNPGPQKVNLSIR